MQCGSRVQIVSDDGVTALAEIADANESVVNSQMSGGTGGKS